MTVDETPTGNDNTTSATGSTAGQDEPAPARKSTRSRRATAPAAEPDAAGAAAEPGSKPSRGRTARKQPTPARRKVAAAAESAPPAAPAEEPPTRRRRGRSAAAGDTPPETSPPETSQPEGAAPEPESAPRGAGGIMPLFQAPEPSVAPRPRRAATRPAGPPQVELVEDADAGADGSGREAPGDADGDEPGDDETTEGRRRRRRRGGRGRRGRGRAEGDEAGDGEAEEPEDAADEPGEEEPAEGATGSSRRRRRRRRRGSETGEGDLQDEPGTVVRVREPRRDDVVGVRGSTRLEAKKQRRREGRDAGRRRTVLSEAEFLARRESVERVMVVRELDGRTQIGVLEDGVLVEHYVARKTQSSMVGNVYLGKVQNVLPSMEAAFVDVGRGRNAVLYAGEVNWDTAGLDGQPRRIEHALKSGESVLVQVTKDPIGHKGARLTSQVSLPGRYLVYVPEGSMTGISRKLPDTERARLKKILRDVIPDDAGVIVRTAAEGASEAELERDVSRLRAQWEDIAKKASSVSAPALLYGEPDLAIRVVRDIFNEDFNKLVISGDEVWDTLEAYIGHVAPDLASRVERWTSEDDVFAAHGIDEQLAKALERKVWLPSGGSLVIDRTEAMTVVDVNTGKFTGAGGNLEETVTKNNLEAAEEIVRQLRLRDIGGIIVIDFIDMVLESNRDLVLRRLVECLGRDRTKHQVAEVTSLGLVQMTRKRVGQGLLEVFSEPCEVCGGRGVIIHDEPVEKRPQQREAPRQAARSRPAKRGSSARKAADAPVDAPADVPADVPVAVAVGGPAAMDGAGDTPNHVTADRFDPAAHGSVP